MALAPAVTLRLRGTNTVHQLFEYPEDIDALDDAVLEHLITDGTPYTMWVGGAVIQQVDLEAHAASADVLEVSVVLGAPKLGSPAKVVLKLLGRRPVQKHELAEFPEDMDELDDHVICHLVPDGSSYQLRADGSILTAEKYVDYKCRGAKLVVHVLKSDQSDSSAAPQAAGHRAPPPGARPRAAGSAYGGSPDLQGKMQGLHHVRDQVAEAAAFAYAGGVNVLIVKMQAESNLFSKVKEDAAAVEVRDTALGAEAKGLLDKMRLAFDAGLTETLSTRKTIGKIQLLLQQMGGAFIQGSTGHVQTLMGQCQLLAKKMDERSANMTAMLESLQLELSVKYDGYAEAEKKYRRAQACSGTLSLVSFGGAAVSGAGAAIAGLGVAAEASTAAAAAAAATAWNPVGLGLLVGAGIFGIVSMASARVACCQGLAKDSMGKMGGIVETAHKAGALNQGMWNGISKHLGVASSALEDLSVFSPEQLDIFGQAMVEAAESLSMLEKAVDEYLVYLDTKSFYPMTFNVKATVGRDRYAQIVGELSIEAGTQERA